MSRGRRAVVWLQAGAGATLIVLLALPLSRTWLEASLVGHVLAQMPLLALSGWLFGAAFAPRFDKVMGRWNQFGVPGLTLVMFTMFFWMLPRSVDSAVQDIGYEVLKFVSLPCAGAALALSFQRTNALLGLISLLGVLAWLYTAAPVRLCISYLSSDQEMLGVGMALLAAAFALNWTFGLFFGPARPSSAGGMVDVATERIGVSISG
jgi:hypothetical protein